MNPVDDEIQDLRLRLQEAEDTLRAIRCGEVDALVVQGIDGERVFTLRGDDHPYRELMESMQQGAVRLDVDGTILYCNRCFASMLKTPQEKVIGSTVSRFLPQAQQERFGTLLLSGRTSHAQCEVQFRAGDGSLLDVYVALASLLESQDASLCMVVTDLTEHKKQLNLQEENRRKDEFLAMLAHELRNPLAPLQNAVEILKHLQEPHDTLVYARDIIERQVHHMTRLVDDLLDVARITSGKVKLQMEPIELATVLVRAAEFIRPATEAKRQRLMLSLPPNGIKVVADPTRLTQVFGNLLANAAKYTDEGGRITLATVIEEETVTVHVRDTGIGIGADLLPRIFDMFIQGNRSLARSEGGLGIGLTLVRRLVDLHGGTVEARSDGPGMGSDFAVRLSLIPDEARPADPIGHPERAGSGVVGRTVLIIEDNRDAADSLGLLLRLAGHRVQVTYSGPDGLQAASLSRPDVVFLDIGLPGMSGYEVARRLREQDGFADTLVVAMTGYGHEDDIRRSSEVGIDQHVVKPVKPEKLEELLRATVPRA